MSPYLAADAAIPYPAQLPYDKQAVPVPGTQRPGQTAHYVNNLWGLLDPSKYRIQTAPDLFASGLSLGPDRPFLGYRPIVSTEPLRFASYYKWHTYGEVDTRRRRIGSGIEHLFHPQGYPRNLDAIYSNVNVPTLGGGELETVGIWSANRPEWQMIDLALQSYNKVGVTLYDTLGKDSVEYIITHAHLTIVFTTLDHVPALLKLVPKTPLKVVVSIDPISSELRRVFGEWGAALGGIRVMDLQELEALGESKLISPLPNSPSSIASICYTSGTTSAPKGVVLTHGALASSVITNLFGITDSLNHDSILFSYLPLAHIYERINSLIMAAYGGAIGYSTNSPLRLIEDAQALGPHFFPGVPRVLNRLYQAAMGAGSVPGLKGALFRRAMAVKLAKWKSTGDNTHLLWDRLVFSKIAGVLGGRIKLVSSGSAPISKDVVDFLNVAFSCYVCEGWGMTETNAVGTKVWPKDPSACGTVGPPQSAIEAKLVDVPAMGYTSEDKPNPRGELCVRGPCVFNVYYKDEKNTKEAVDEEGWAHTGDVAEVDEVGRFKIIDRVKNIMKLAQGEYVALEKIENVYSACPAVAQIYVHGDGLRSHLVAIVIPDPVQLASIAQSVLGQQVAPEDGKALEAVCRDELVRRRVFELLEGEARKEGLNGIERIKHIHLSLNLFSVEDGTLTPTFKIKRKDAYNKFKAELDGLYALGERTATKL